MIEQCPVNRRLPLLRDRERLGLLLDARLTHAQIAAALDCSESAVSRWVVKHFGQRGRYAELSDGDWLAARRAEGWSQRRIAAELGCTPRAVRDALDRHGLPRRLDSS